MRRTGLFLMAILLAVPILRECCLPTVASHHCQPKNSDSRPCSPNPVAVAQNKTTVEFSTIDFGFVDRVVRDSAQFESPSITLGEFSFVPSDRSIHLYLRTHVLLI